MLGAIALIALLFIFITAGLYLGELLNSYWQGFVIVSGFTIFVILILLLCKKSIQTVFTNRIVNFLMKQDDKDEKISDK
jgi:hypothetical protein